MCRRKASKVNQRVLDRIVQRVVEVARPEKIEEPDTEILPIPIHAFDCVIANECHRGYTSAEESKWREALDHFDGIKIGLTATPALNSDVVEKLWDFATPFGMTALTTVTTSNS